MITKSNKNRGRTAAIRTYILHVGRQPVFSKLVQGLKALDPEEQEAEYARALEADQARRQVRWPDGGQTIH